MKPQQISISKSFLDLGGPRSLLLPPEFGLLGTTILVCSGGVIIPIKSAAIIFGQCRFNGARPSYFGGDL